MSVQNQSRHRDKWLARAGILTDALPYMRRYNGQTVVIKYGGHAMGDADLALQFARDIVLLKQCGINPILVHGGGPQIAKMLEKLGVESRFVDGLRISDAPTMDVVEMVLSGKVNKQIVTAIQAVGGFAVGLSGKDGNLLRARRLHHISKETGQPVDLGLVGAPDHVNPRILEILQSSEAIPVIAPLAYGAGGETYNINADIFAGTIAGAIKARRFLLLTDVEGVKNENGELITALNPQEAQGLIDTGVVKGGMIPKLETCLQALDAGVDASVIIDGRKPHTILLEMFTTHGSGTIINRIEGDASGQ
ncbi:MAG: acetylglutamate kinase [Pseudomonadota bacterium]